MNRDIHCMCRLARVLLLPVIVSVALSACATTNPQMIGWDHVRDGLRENIYTGDDHI